MRSSMVIPVALMGATLNAQLCVDIEGNITQRDVDTSKMPIPEGMTFAGAKMPYFQRFTGGFGLHAGVVPNRRASHGCVRLPRIMAERLFTQTSVGTPVTVQD